MNNALIIGSHPLFRLAIADLLNRKKITSITEDQNISPNKSVDYDSFSLLVLCLEAGDSCLLQRLMCGPRLSTGRIVVFSQVFGKRHRRLLLRSKIDLCLPLAVHCNVARSYLKGIFAPNESVFGMAALDDPEVSSRFLPDLDDLSNSERVVLYHLQQGLSNRAIAERMNLQLNTVKVHLSRACRKAGFGNRTQAALTTHDLISSGALSV